MYISNEARESAFNTLWKQENLSYIAILYCNAEGEVDYTPIRVDGDFIYIECEAWPEIDGARYANLEDLLNELGDMSFKQVPGAMDSIELPWSSHSGLPITLREQLSQSNMFMLDRRYSFNFQFDPKVPGPGSFPIVLDGDSVYVNKGTISAVEDTRFDNLDSLLEVLATHGKEARILDWGMDNHSVRTPKITWL